MSTATTPPERRTAPRPGTLILALATTVLAVSVALLLGLRQLERQADVELARRIEAQRQGAAERGTLFIPRVDREALPLDPLDPSWNLVPAAPVQLNRQTDAMPMLERATVEQAELRAASDGERVVWRLSWPDPSPDMNVDSGRFCDAAALQLPLAGDAPYTMGDDRHPVQILHWKALWQLDVDEHFQDVQDLHPNYWADLYWFAQGEAPYRVPDAFADPRSRAWFAAYSAGNPVSDLERTRPVEELTAAGWGSLTSQEASVSDGRGVWSDGRWQVSFVRPLRTADPHDAQLWRGGSGSIGVAIWNGGDGNVGGRKHWGYWLGYEVSP